MKRDMDLCRRVLLHIEGMPSGIRTIDLEDLQDPPSGLDQETLDNHVKLLCNAGFVHSTSSYRRGAPLVKGLTWNGHEFLDKSRDDNLWCKAKKIVVEKTGGLAVEALSSVLSELIKKATAG